jgi:murein tripeptide amidase MpaA
MMKFNFYCWLLHVIITLKVLQFANGQADFVYHDYAKLTELLKNYSSSFANKAHLYSIGKSVQGRELWVLAMADTQPNVHIPLRPEVKYVGNMHGNEVPSKEILIHFIDYVLRNQFNDPDVDYLLKTTRIHVMVSMNPDGYEISRVEDCESTIGRFNAKNYDLNRNFPDLFECNQDPIQIETKSALDWFHNNSFVLSANFHTGAVVVNYPFDNSPIENEYKLINNRNPTDDDDIFRNISKVYSSHNPAMRNNKCNNFTDGIVNGGRPKIIKLFFFFFYFYNRV